MKTAMSIVSTLLALLVLSCGKKDSIPPFNPPVTTVDITPQYGTPFNNVTDRQDAVIYQVNMRTFSAQGNLAGVTARLDSIKALGVNVIYLMPVYPVGTLNAFNSPYCVKDFATVSNEFGTLDDLRTLVEGAHNRNMSVILDFIANHTSWDHPWITTHKDWYVQNTAGNIISPPNTGWNDVAQLNFSNTDLRQAVIKAMKYWVYAANIDGYRCDYTDGSPVDFWKQAIDTLRNISSHKLLLLAEGSRYANYSAGFDYNFGFGFFSNLKQVYNNNRSVLSIDSMNAADYTNASNGQQVVRYTTNHDVNSSDGTPEELFGGGQGSMAAFVVVSCMKGVPMIYNGQEVGMPVRLSFPFTATKIDWTINKEVTAQYKKIIQFRNNSQAIRRGMLTSYANADVCVFSKEQGGEKVLVMANLRNNTVNYNLPPVLVNTSWTDVLKGSNTTLGNTMSLPPFTYIILKN